MANMRETNPDSILQNKPKFSKNGKGQEQVVFLPLVSLPDFEIFLIFTKKLKLLIFTQDLRPYFKG